ncbi:DUF3768 domain-containing protein [Magnetospirillum aberrantis]|uniref:DUF3768 domain-containing protein n=1 Tax=Magnetospirillum aberrantis SpK TaxID=908842 RepID=A0A7C9QU83_9PROT|nr:DUF3768 domain-containing protein [Magnetospirillum aberrantis]NFV80685.1 DUF3768 domain-containing protein [Magnetospirillum aberrantis SpK]
MIIDKAERIRRLNDSFRRSFQGGKVFLTEGVRALGNDQLRAILRQVRTFDAFTPDNDPYQEHDFGAFDEGGKRVFWKIDYFDAEIEGASADPSDPEATTRVMTVMLAEEW